MFLCCCGWNLIASVAVAAFTHLPSRVAMAFDAEALLALGLRVSCFSLLSLSVTDLLHSVIFTISHSLTPSVCPLVSLSVTLSPSLSCFLDSLSSITSTFFLIIVVSQWNAMKISHCLLADLKLLNKTTRLIPCSLWFWPLPLILRIRLWPQIFFSFSCGHQTLCRRGGS